MSRITLFVLCVFLSVWSLLWVLSLVLCIRRMRQGRFSQTDIVQYLFYIFITAGIAFPFVLTRKNSKNDE